MRYAYTISRTSYAVMLRFIPSTSSSSFVSRDGLANTSRRYLKKYAHNEHGTYIGTEKAVLDAGLVFVPSKSSAELLEQVKKVAFGRERDPWGRRERCK